MSLFRGPFDRLYQVGGINHHVVGHKVTPAFGTDPYRQQKSEDIAVVDLANQLDCIISRELDKMNISSLTVQAVDQITDPKLPEPNWCNDYWVKIQERTQKDPTHSSDALVNIGPTDSFDAE